MPPAFQPTAGRSGRGDLEQLHGFELGDTTADAATGQETNVREGRGRVTQDSDALALDHVVRLLEVAEGDGVGVGAEEPNCALPPRAFSSIAYRSDIVASIRTSGTG